MIPNSGKCDYFTKIILWQQPEMKYLRNDLEQQYRVPLDREKTSE
jgi:hypothetical protein